MKIEALHHVQLAMPPAQEDQARAFYGKLLGFDEVAKPAELAARGGVWFENETVRVHLGVEHSFQPARKAHPAFQVRDLAALRLVLLDGNVKITPDSALPGYNRFYAQDPFGNRLEFLEPKV